MDFVRLQHQTLETGGKFEITLREDGNAAYECNFRHAVLPGKWGLFKGVFNKRDFQLLKRAIADLRLDAIVKGSMRVLDGTDVTLTTFLDGSEFSFKEDAHLLPAPIWIIDKAMLGVASLIRWEEAGEA